MTPDAERGTGADIDAGAERLRREAARVADIYFRAAQEQDVTAPPDDLDADTLRKMSRTDMIRVLDEFRSERDSAKRSAMRAFDERNVALAENATLTAENKALREALRDVVIDIEVMTITDDGPYQVYRCRLCEATWSNVGIERHAPGCLAAGAASER